MNHRLKLYTLKTFLSFFLRIAVLSGGIMLRDYTAKEDAPDAQYDYEDVQMKITVSSGPKPPEYDVQELLSINPDFRAWLQIPDTVVNLPVVQGMDNAYYLKHSFHKNKSGFGCLFLDYRTTASDRSLVIHGHNMGINRDEMFSSLINYQDQSYAETHQTLFYSDPNKPGKEQYTLFAVLNHDIRNKAPFNYRQQQFADDAEFQAFVSFLKENSIFESDYHPTGEIIILSTCNNAFGENNRLLICAGRNQE